jgi:hypothetical protein
MTLRYHVRRVIERCQQGEVLCLSYRTMRTGETETLALFEPSGRPCGILAAQEAIASGLLEAGGDSLLDNSFSQTWRARHAPPQNNLQRSETSPQADSARRTHRPPRL